MLTVLSPLTAQAPRVRLSERFHTLTTDKRPRLSALFQVNRAAS